MIVRMKRRNIGEERLIDLSTLEAQKAFFENSYEKWGHYVAEAGPKLGRSIEHGEVLICFKGMISIDDMEIVDENSGRVSMPYKDALAQLYFLRSSNHGTMGRLTFVLVTNLGDKTKITEHLCSEWYRAPAQKRV